jgi:hypothetical protein
MWTTVLLFTNGLTLAGLLTVWVTVQSSAGARPARAAFHACQEELQAARHALDAAHAEAQRRGQALGNGWTDGYRQTPVDLPQFK